MKRKNRILIYRVMRRISEGNATFELAGHTKSPRIFLRNWIRAGKPQNDIIFIPVHPIEP